MGYKLLKKYKKTTKPVVWKKMEKQSLGNVDLNFNRKCEIVGVLNVSLHELERSPIRIKGNKEKLMHQIK